MCIRDSLYTIYNQLHEFIRALGYHSYGATNLNGFGPAVAFAELGGLGENSRLDCLITPERGPMVRLAAMITDLPDVYKRQGPVHPRQGWHREFWKQYPGKITSARLQTCARQ